MSRACPPEPRSYPWGFGFVGRYPGSGVTRLSGIYLGTETNPGSSGSGEKR